MKLDLHVKEKDQIIYYLKQNYYAGDSLISQKEWTFVVILKYKFQMKLIK